MVKFLKSRGIDLAVVSIALSVAMIGPAWATLTVDMPAPGVVVLAGGAIIGALVIAKWWRRK